MGIKTTAKREVLSVSQPPGKRSVLGNLLGLRKEVCGEMLLDKFALEVLERIEALREAGVPFKDAIERVRREITAEKTHDLQRLRGERSLRATREALLEESNRRLSQFQVELKDLKDKIEELIALLRRDAQ